MSERKGYTDDEINNIVAKQTRPLRAQLGELQQKLAAHERIKTELTAAVEGVTAERDAARTELASTKEQHATAIAAARGAAIQVQLTHALLAASLLPSAADIATRELGRTARIDADESGVIRGITIGEAQFADATEAARQWLQSRPYFVRASGGGSGTLSPAVGHSGGGWRTPAFAGETSAADLMRKGLQEPPR